MPRKESEHLFYDEAVLVDREQEHINNILKKYQDEPVTDELKQKIWDELQHEKHLGNIKVPFRIATRRDAFGKYPECIEIILDTRI